jgi:hypothetical protein
VTCELNPASPTPFRNPSFGEIAAGSLKAGSLKNNQTVCDGEGSALPQGGCARDGKVCFPHRSLAFQGRPRMFAFGGKADKVQTGRFVRL